MKLSKVRDFNTGIANNLGGDVYEIEADAEFFNHLSKRIYTDSKLAIVRELTCNAWDSHVEAGNKDLPVIIQCPNQLQPVFKVIDRGLGMDIETLNGVYRKYGKSTKRTDMKQTGGLGVGSKTPFAYTDSFTVYSVKDGFKHTMINYKENGIPKIKEIITTETDEPNGVTVEVPVKVDDFEDFEERIRSMANMFGGNLEVRGMNYNFEEDNIYATMGETNKHKMLDFVFPDNMFHIPAYKARVFTSSKFLVLMGNVPYQLDISKLKLSDGALAFLNDVTSSGRVTCFEVPIGCVDFSMSREHLEYSDRTTDYLEHYINDLRADARDYVEECLKEATCDIDHYQRSMNIYNAASSLFDSRPEQKCEHLICLNMRRRNFRRLKKSKSRGAKFPLIMIGLDSKVPHGKIDIKKWWPEVGRIVVHLIHYQNNKMLRKKMTKAYDEDIIDYNKYDKVICGMMSVEQADAIENIIRTNTGANIEFIDIRRVNLDNIHVERDVTETSSEPRDKVVTRVYRDEYHSYTVALGEMSTQYAEAVFVWLPSQGRQLRNEDYPYEEFEMIQEFLQETGYGDSTMYRIAGIGSTHKHYLKMFPDQFIHYDEFKQEHLTDVVTELFDACMAKSEHATIYALLELIYGFDKACDIAEACDLTGYFESTKSTIETKLVAIQKIMPMFGHKTYLSFPLTNVLIRKTVLKYKGAVRRQRNEPKTPIELLVEQHESLALKIRNFRIYGEKRNKKLKFKRRDNYVEIKL